MSPEPRSGEGGVPLDLPADEPKTQAVTTSVPPRTRMEAVVAFLMPFLIGMLVGGAAVCLGVWAIDRQKARRAPESGLAGSDRQTAAQGSQPPANPIDIFTEVGTAATRFGQVEVRIEAKVMRSGVRLHTTLVETGNRSFSRVTLETTQISELITVLDAVLAKPDSLLSQKRGDLLITNTHDDGKYYTQITQSKDNAAGLSNSVTLDTDNVKSVRQLLAKSQGVQQWVRAKAAAMQQ